MLPHDVVGLDDDHTTSTGRVDRIGSLTHRRLDGRTEPPPADELLQVYYSYLGDTVERLQVERVFEILNER